jgi:hypothetical protein
MAVALAVVLHQIAKSSLMTVWQLMYLHLQVLDESGLLSIDKMDGKDQ